MKKVRLNLKRGSKPWSLMLYDSSESAFYLKDEPIYGDAVDEEYRKIITLRRGEILEVEWIGSEWVFDDEDSIIFRSTSGSFDKYDKVRVGKISPIKGSTEKLGYLEVYSGWIFGGDVPWSSGFHKDCLKVTLIKDLSKSKFDFQHLFSDPAMGLLQQQEDEISLGEVLN